MAKDDALSGLYAQSKIPNRDCPLCERNGRVPANQITIRSKQCKECYSALTRTKKPRGKQPRDIFPFCPPDYYKDY